MIIAVDGPTASGKGTIAAGLAKHYGLKRLDSVRRRGRRMCQQGWDINALALLFEELQTLAGACGRWGGRPGGEAGEARRPQARRCA